MTFRKEEDLLAQFCAEIERERDAGEIDDDERRDALALMADFLLGYRLLHKVIRHGSYDDNISGSMNIDEEGDGRFIIEIGAQRFEFDDYLIEPEMETGPEAAPPEPSPTTSIPTPTPMTGNPDVALLWDDETQGWVDAGVDSG